MTMADTIAVMNAGRIEQMGAPAELYENPAHHVRRQLPRPVQPDPGHRRRPGRRLRDRGAAHRNGAGPAGRLPAGVDEVWVGVRPEKIGLQRRGGSRRTAPAGRTGSSGGMVTDASFIGVSTQYLVRTPWGQELMVFEQNRDGSGTSTPPATGSACRSPPSTPSPWTPARTPTRASRSTASCLMTGAAEPAVPAAPPDGRRSPAVGRGALVLLLPGMLWLAVFFVVPMVFLLSQSLQTGRPGDRLPADLALRQLRRRAVAASPTSSCARSSTPSWPPCWRC